MFESNTTDLLWEVFFQCTVDLDYTSRHMLLFFLYLIAFVVGLAANGVVVWVNWPQRHSSNPEVFCTLNICVSHLMVMTVMPIFLLEVMMNHVWMWGKFLCLFTNFIYEFNYYSTSFFLAYLAVERYQMVARGPAAARPWGPDEKRRRALMCAGLWIFALLLSPVLVSNVQVVEYHTPGCYLLPDRNYALWMVVITMTSFTFQFLIPGAVILTCNWLAAQALKRSPELRSSSAVDVKMYHVYSAVFIAHWLPYHIVCLLIMVDDLNPLILSCDSTNIVYYSAYVMLALSHFHYITNPVLYNFLQPGFRRSLLRLVARYVRGQTQCSAGGGVEVGVKNKVRSAAAGPRKISNASTSQSDVD
ncbi:hypothetical protein ACEWY4_012945 [Coilia grayii]|uniref:G-protein coupled receptors family 1 profile domain-containing protein n=1 Tax=Coilia grayii TaxID=363190 RepID=A0ABD1JV09_9TELE